MRVAIALTLVALAGCSTVAPGHPSESESADTGRLVGHLGLYGGAPQPNGHMSVSDAPRPGATVTATGSHRAYRAVSDANGRFAFTLPPGRYVVTSPDCERRTVTVRADQTTTQPIVCPVP